MSMDPGPSTVYAIYKFGYVLNLDSSLHIPSLTLSKSFIMSLCESFLQRTSARPDKDTNLKAWNKSWEDDLRRYDRLVWEGATARLPPEFHKLPQGTPAFRQRETAKETLAALQSQTRDLALMRLATDDFEEKFRTMHAARREQTVLEAFHWTASQGMEGYRTWCPDMTVQNMSQRGGRYFLELLKRIVTEGPTASKSGLVNFPHPTVDMVFIPKHVGDALRTIREERCCFISMVIWRIISKFVSRS